VSELPTNCAFGLAVGGIPSSEWLAVRERHPSWPRLRLEQVVEAQGARRPRFEGRRSFYRLPSGRQIDVDLDAGVARFSGSEVLEEDRLVHPGVQLVAGLASRMLGRDAYHAGAFICDGGAWMLAGTNGAGKSSLLAALAAAGVTVLADDLAVIDGGEVLAGTRCLDLREWQSSARDQSVVTVRGESRLRVTLGPAPAAAPLHGMIHLVRSARLELATAPASGRLERLARRRMWAQIPVTPRAALELATLPTLELRVPENLKALPDVASFLRQRLAA
jgi:hypothetical protein